MCCRNKPRGCCHLSTWEVEAGGSGIQSHSWLHNEFKPAWATWNPTQRPKPKNKLKEPRRQEGSWRVETLSHAVSVVSTSFESQDSAVSKIVFEIGCSSSRALPLQFSVRPTRLFEVHPDVTSHANRRSLVQALWACALSSLPVLGSLAVTPSVTWLWLSVGSHAHIQDTFSV